MVEKVNAALKQYIADGSWEKSLNSTVGPPATGSRIHRRRAPPDQGAALGPVHRTTLMMVTFRPSMAARRCCGADRNSGAQPAFAAYQTASDSTHLAARRDRSASDPATSSSTPSPSPASRSSSCSPGGGPLGRPADRDQRRGGTARPRRPLRVLGHADRSGRSARGRSRRQRDGRGDPRLRSSNPHSRPPPAPGSWQRRARSPDIGSPLPPYSLVEELILTSRWWSTSPSRVRRRRPADDRTRARLRRGAARDGRYGLVTDALLRRESWSRAWRPPPRPKRHRCLGSDGRAG